MKVETPTSDVTTAKVQRAPGLRAKRVRAAEIRNVATTSVEKVKSQYLFSANQRHARPFLHGNVMVVILCITQVVRYVVSSEGIISK